MLRLSGSSQDPGSSAHMFSVHILFMYFFINLTGTVQINNTVNGSKTRCPILVSIKLNLQN